MTQLTRRVTTLCYVWHWFYCRWYDADRAGHPRRARAWGRVADWIARRT